MLQKMVLDEDLAEADPDKNESVPEKIIMSLRRSSGDTSSSSDSASDSDSQPDTDRKKKSSSSPGSDKEQLGQEDDDVIILDEHSANEGKDDDGDPCDWATKAEYAERDWVVPFPNANPLVIPKWKEIKDGWYKGEDCAHPSHAAPPSKHLVMPSADGSLALKGDAALPNAPPGHEKFRDRDLERRVHYPKAKRRGHEELDSIAP